MNEHFAWLDLTFAVGVLLLRLLQVGAGVLLCVLGYRLFARVRSGNATADLSLGTQLKLNFSKVGPGVFFALFGTAVLVQALLRPLTLERSSSVGAGAARPTPAASTASGVPSDSAVAAASGAHSIKISGALPESRMSASLATPALEADELARHLRFTNRLSGLLKPGLPMDQRVQFDTAQSELKRALLRAGWHAEWGDRAAFEAWLLRPVGDPPSRAAFELWSRS